MSLDKKFLEAQMLYEKRIADLEAKLAESNENFHHAKKEWESLLHKTCVENLELIEKLGRKLAEKDDELLQKEREIEDLQLCEFVATTLDFNKLSADNCRLRDQIQNMEANKEKEINRICKTHIEANERLKQQLAEKEKLIEFYINSGKEQCDEINRINHHATNQAEEIDRLNNQLAEKEKEVHELVERQLETFKDMKEWKWHATVGANQDKIELMEKVKATIKKAPITDYDINEHFTKIYQSDVIRIIDTLIKEIKGE